MSIEFPVLRLGVAGFPVPQLEQIAAGLKLACSGAWEIAEFAGADGWWLNGARVQLLSDHMIRVPAGEPGGRSLHLALQDVDRPIAFAQPVAAHGFEALCSFDPGSLPSIVKVLEKFDAWLRPVVAQFCLASSLLEQERVLGRGVHHVTANGALIAVVDMRGETGVLPNAGPVDFEDAMWQCLPPASGGAIPEHFVRCSLSRLMWQYAVRTGRDILPAKYRRRELFFRRPPRLPNRLLTDSHLLLLRELAACGGDFESLGRRTGMAAGPLARDLAALYFVGAITTDPKRAAGPSRPPADADSSRSQQHSIPSGIGVETAPQAPRVARCADATVPAPMRPI
jgi:hypothetical protein